MSIAKHRVAYYFDTVSPWAYIGFEVMRRYRAQWNVDLELKPINLGYVMQQSGNKPPISVANKGIWMHEDMQRAQKFYGVTLNRSERFPINTMPPQCLLRLMVDEDPNKLEGATEAFFKAAWVNDQVALTKEELRGHIQHLYKGNESKMDELIEKSFSKESKERVKSESRNLVDSSGAFGMPWIIVTRKQDGQEAKFFGSDRFEQIAAFLDVPYKGGMADGSVAKL